MVMLVKDFAAQQGVSAAIIYKHLKTHQADLEGLIIKKPKQTLLTDEAQEYLKSIMMDRTVISVSDAAQAKRIIELEAENKQLLQQLADARGALASALGELGEQKALAATAQAAERERDYAQQQVQELQLQRDDARTQLQKAETATDHAKQEIERLRNRSLWQRILNK